MKPTALIALLLFGLGANAKTFQNSYVSFEVPDNWNCLQEGVAWTCTPSGPLESKEAVIVLAAKVAGPEDNLQAFLNYLKQPKKITTKVGTPMPSQVSYAQERMLAGTRWVQAQHLGSEIQEYYTLYLATVKEQLAILVSFSAERNRYQVYNPIFDRAIKTLKITANQQLLFPKSKSGGTGEVIGIQAGPLTSSEALLPPPERKSSSGGLVYLLGLGAIVGASLYFLTRKRKKSPSKPKPPRQK